MRRTRNKITWKVLNYNINLNQIEQYDVLTYREKQIKQLKKEAENKEHFSELLNREMMWQYWSRAEYELILERIDNQLYLKPWVGCRNTDEVKIEVTDDAFWSEFAKSRYRSWWGNECKIDIYDQLIARWEEFVEYLWTTHLPYERRKEL